MTTKTKGNFTATIALLSVLAVIAAAALYFTFSLTASPRAGASTGKALIGGPFTLQNDKGEAVTEAILNKDVNFVYFGFTNCPDFCPTELANLAEARQALAKRGLTSRIVFVTVDPARDTKEVLGEYVRYFDEEAIGLTGDRAQVDEAVKAYRVYYKLHEPDENGYYVVDHSTIVYAMDKNGEFIKHFNDNTPPEQIADALTAAL